MESIPAAALPIAIATDTQPAREGASGHAGGFSTFEQVLEKEISVVSADTEQATADAPAAALATTDLLAKSDTTQILDVILDSAGMLVAMPPAAVPASIAAPSQPRAEVGVEVAGDASLRTVHTAGQHVRADAPMGVPGELSRAGSSGVDGRPGRPETTPVPSTADVVGVSLQVTQDVQQRSADAASPAQPRGPAAAVAAPLAPSDQAFDIMRALASAGRAPTAAAEMLAPAEKAPAAAEMLPPAEKAPTPTLTAERSPLQAAFSIAAREETQGRSVAEDLLAQRLELRAERMPTDSTGTSAGVVSVPVEPTTLPREGLAALDTLSSAALMQRSTPAPHMGASSASAATAVVRIDTPLAAQGWSEAFRQQVVWLVDRQLETAELHVNPPHLGPVDVVLKVTDDGARIAFCSPHAAVREAIESSLAELRSSLAERGLSLGQALVSADPGSAREQMMREQNVRGAPRISDAAQGVEGETAVLPLRRGLVDTFV